MTSLRGVWKENGRERDRSIKHITIRTMDPAHLPQFYTEVVELKEEEKAFEDPNYYLTDGKVTLVLTPWDSEDYQDTEHRCPGLPAPVMRPGRKSVGRFRIAGAARECAQARL